ncbi:MAG: hypothetical protein Q9174_000656 [Haloplaca sp. 1 TL-2023]
MAANVADNDDLEFEPSDETVERWQYLFSYTKSEAIQRIKDQKSDVYRHRLSDDTWELLRAKEEAAGFDRDSYEHWLSIKDQVTIARPKKESPTNSVYLVKLEAVLGSPENIQAIANLPHPPQVRHASTENETEAALFCRIDGITRQAIGSWLSHHHPAFKPMFIPLKLAAKALSAESISPTLGLEATLAQHRPHSRTALLNQQVSQDQYPVWYFFYGTLAEPSRLRSLQALPDAESPVLIPAKIYGGTMRRWAGKYKALVDGTDTGNVVHGSAYEVLSKEREDSLRQYETPAYEVVRCTIVMAEKTVLGLTFRFVDARMLD